MTASRSLHSLMLVLCATVAASSPAFISAPGLNCTCAAGSLGYECRMPASNACFSKNGGVCPGGTEQLPDCCAHCAGDHPQRGVCQDSLNLACYPAAADGTCPPGTQKCPPASKPTPAPSAPPCTAKPTLCVQPSYCGQSSDPDAAYTDGSGCSCGWGYHYSNKTGKCEEGSCQGHCHTDPQEPCAPASFATCYPLVSGNCPAKTINCNFD